MFSVSVPRQPLRILFSQPPTTRFPAASPAPPTAGPFKPGVPEAERPLMPAYVRVTLPSGETRLAEVIVPHLKGGWREKYESQKFTSLGSRCPGRYSRGWKGLAGVGQVFGIGICG